MVQLVLLFQELWRRSKESGETLSHTKVTKRYPSYMLALIAPASIHSGLLLLCPTSGPVTAGTTISEDGGMVARHVGHVCF